MPATARADVIGSLLRPDYLRAARQRARERSITAAELRAAEDRAVDEAIALQARAGVDVITDGELRRAIWIATGGTGLERGLLSGPLEGFGIREIAPHENWMSLWQGADGGNHGQQLSRMVFITERLRATRDLAQTEYAYLQAHTTKRTKYTLPAPSWHRVQWHPVHSKDVYPTAGAYLRDMRDYLRGVIDAVIALGCDYIQLDAPNYAMFHTDPRVRAFLQAGGRDLDAELAEDAEIDNSVFEGLRGSGSTCALHVCRGNSASHWLANGGYQPLAVALFPRLTNVDTLLLEYDTPRAGDFGPLQQVRPDTTVVLGLLTTKAPDLEDADALAARIHEAERYVPLERLALSPQCGFASVEAGNAISPAEQEAKLGRLVETARRVWQN